MTETFLDTKGLKCPLPVLRARRAMKVLAAGDLLRIEATDTTPWFGFKDDLVVRIRPGEVSSVDVRSVSRVGQSDVGANAARIMKFIEAF